MTKIIIIGQDPVEVRKKKIEFVYCIDLKDLTISEADQNATIWKHVELIQRNTTGLDVMFAYDDDRNNRSHSALYLGNFNDGVV